MIGYRLTFILIAFLFAAAWSPSFLAGGLLWVVVPGLILIAILDFTEIGNAMR